MNKRKDKFKQYLIDNGMDSAVVTNSADIRYLTGFTGEGYAVISHSGDRIVTDFRYINQAKTQTDGIEICDVASFSAKEAFAGFKNTGFEDLSVSYKAYCGYKENFQKLTPLGAVLSNQRAVKDEDEIAFIKKAQDITDRAFTHILDYIKPGVTERDVALELEYFMRSSGAENVSFDVIAATGAHGAMPHAEPDGRLIGNGEFVVLDFGCVVDGYCSDMTRTVCAGKATDEMKKVYNTVLDAQLTALEMIREGIPGRDVHNRAAEIIDELYPGRFGHGLGHGVGLEIHENPNLSPRNPNPLKTGNVVTVEPGIYIDGFCGGRIEDLEVVQAEACLNLTHSTKKLIEI